MFASRMERLRSQDNMKMYYAEATMEDKTIWYRVYAFSEEEAFTKLVGKWNREYPNFPDVTFRFTDCPPEFECESDF